MNKKNVEIYVTSGDKTSLLEKVEFSNIDESNKTNKTKILIDLTDEKQTIDGFGAALTESSAYLIDKLSKDKQERLLNDLFTSEGLDISFLRITMGASDFSLSNFTYCDSQKEDINLDNFSIEEDKKILIPMLKKIIEKKSPLIMATPWSAPAWMKDNKSLNGGKLLKEYFDVYANYFSKYILEYRKENIDIYAVTVQNEPLHEVNTYPTMYMDSHDQKELIKHIGKSFEENHIATKIIAYDHNWDDIEYSKNIYEDAGASKYVSGSAFHCYKGDVSATALLAKEFADKDIWFTECSGGQWATNFSDNLVWNIENVFIGSLKNMAKSVLLWNLALDQQCGPINGGCLNCRGVVTIDSANESIERNEEYYIIGHFSKFVKKEAIVIGSTTNDESSLSSIAFKNTDNSIVVVVLNKSKQDKNIQIVIEDVNIDYVLKYKSVASFVIK